MLIIVQAFAGLAHGAPKDRFEIIAPGSAYEPSAQCSLHLSGGKGVSLRVKSGCVDGCLGQPS